MPVTTFGVTATGVGRRDYSSASEKFVEPVISSWQSVYTDYRVVNVPASGSVVTDVAVTLNQVVLLYDFFASIPANSLIRLHVQAVDALGAVATVVDKTAYQTVAEHLLKGYPFFKTIRFTLDNYGDVAQDFKIGCCGLYTSLAEYFIRTP